MKNGKRLVPRLSPATVASTAFAFARQFAPHSDAIRKHLPRTTPTVANIMLRFFPSLGDSELFDRNNAVTGTEVIVPSNGGREHAWKGLAPDVHLVFGHDGSFILAERLQPRKRGVYGENLRIEVLTEDGLAALAKRFPDLQWALASTFFPMMTLDLLREITDQKEVSAR